MAIVGSCWEINIFIFLLEKGESISSPCILDDLGQRLIKPPYTVVDTAHKDKNKNSLENNVSSDNFVVVLLT